MNYKMYFQNKFTAFINTQTRSPKNDDSANYKKENKFSARKCAACGGTCSGTCDGTCSGMCGGTSGGTFDGTCGGTCGGT